MIWDDLDFQSKIWWVKNHSFSGKTEHTLKIKWISFVFLLFKDKSTFNELYFFRY
jgi:hypothetical protein